MMIVSMGRDTQIGPFLHNYTPCTSSETEGYYVINIRMIINFDHTKANVKCYD
jgi:hypothetical protein